MGHETTYKPAPVYYILKAHMVNFDVLPPFAFPTLFASMPKFSQPTRLLFCFLKNCELTAILAQPPRPLASRSR